MVEERRHRLHVERELKREGETLGSVEKGQDQCSKVRVRVRPRIPPHVTYVSSEEEAT